uniref:THAP domain-containing protein 1 n=2 Tax=Oryzias latipes TaxID=8090 RepID=H2MB73_ORYLA
MGVCSAPHCSNSSYIGKQLFRFPKDPERKKKWVVNCQRDFEPTPHSRLCQDHFEQSQFEEIAKSSAGRKKLKPNAIPTLFCVRNPPYPAVTTPYIRLTPLKDEPVRVMKKRLYRLSRIEMGLQSFLYEDQIRALSLPKRSRRAVWSPETILEARNIRSIVGTKGYDYLREIGYPLPSYRTLCNRVETKLMVTTDINCEDLDELHLGFMASCESPIERVGDHDEEELIGVLS